MSEAQVENWFWENNIKCIYEPQIVIGDEEFLPDWVLLPQYGLAKPIIVEYWGLCRQDNTLSGWARKKKPRYLDRKQSKVLWQLLRAHRYSNKLISQGKMNTKQIELESQL